MIVAYIRETDPSTLFDTRKYEDLEEDRSLAEEERKGIKQAQAEGIAEAKKKGKHLGRPQINLNTLTPGQKGILDSEYPRWKDNELSAVEFMKKLELKKTLITRL